MLFKKKTSLYLTLEKQIKALTYQVGTYNDEIQFNLKMVSAYENKIKKLYDENEKIKDNVRELHKDIEHLQKCINSLDDLVEAEA